MTGRMIGAEKPEDIVNKGRILALLKEHSEGRTAGEMSKALRLSSPRIKVYITTLSLEYPIGNEGSSNDMNYFLLSPRKLL